MKNYPMAVLMLFSITAIYAQGLTTKDFSSETLRMSKTLGDESYINGSPFIQEKFSPARVTGYDGQLYLARFNAYNSQMIVDLGDKKIALDNSMFYEVTFTKTNKTYRTYSYNFENKKLKNGFLVVVKENDDFALLKEEKVTYIDVVPAATTYQVDKPAKYDRDTDRYYVAFGDSVYFLPSKRKDLLKQFPTKSKELKTFLKDNKVSLKDENDLAELAEFISSMP